MHRNPAENQRLRLLPDAIGRIACLGDACDNDDDDDDEEEEEEEDKDDDDQDDDAADDDHSKVSRFSQR